MSKPSPQIVERNNGTTISKKPNHKRPHTSPLMSSCYSPVFSLFILAICVTLFVLFQIQSLDHTPPFSTTITPSWPSFIHTQITQKLRESTTFLPLKDLRYSNKPLEGHTWFMSSMYDHQQQEGEVQYQEFPSKTSSNRILCLKGRDNHDGSWNYYGLAWPEALPMNATLKKGLTFISYNHYNYENIWHGLSAMVPFVAWHARNGCERPDRWVLYHWGEIRLGMGLWLRSLMSATFDGEPVVEGFEGVGEEEPTCFEKAVVMRHNEGGMSRERRMEVYDLMRCKARVYCNVSVEDDSNVIGMTLLMRSGGRSFRNESAVIDIFRRECDKVDGCKLTVAYSNNLTFCEQVWVMRKTDILVSAHGAQLTNMFLMNRNSSVMEFFPKGWLKLAGVGQYVYQWIASWSGMRHEGAWRDPIGGDDTICSFPEDDRRCMSVYKNAKIGFNHTYFANWAADVLNQVKTRKLNQSSSTGLCACDSVHS